MPSKSPIDIAQELASLDNSVLDLNASAYHNCADIIENQISYINNIFEQVSATNLCASCHSMLDAKKCSCFLNYDKVITNLRLTSIELIAKGILFNDFHMEYMTLDTSTQSDALTTKINTICANLHNIKKLDTEIDNIFKKRKLTCAHEKPSIDFYDPEYYWMTKYSLPTQRYMDDFLQKMCAPDEKGYNTPENWKSIDVDTRNSFRTLYLYYREIFESLKNIQKQKIFEPSNPQ